MRIPIVPRVQVSLADLAQQPLTRGKPNDLGRAFGLGNGRVVVPEETAALELGDEEVDDLYMMRGSVWH